MRILENSLKTTVIAFVFGCALGSQAQTSSQREPINDGLLLFAAKWEVIGPLPLFATITEFLARSETDLPTRKLTVSTSAFDGAEKLMTFETPDIPVSLFPLGTHRHLVTIWESGSGYRLRIYSAISGDVRLALDVGSDWFPEFVVTNTGAEAVLVRKGKSKDADAEVYAWS